jgi:hypothetical protein
MTADGLAQVCNLRSQMHTLQSCTTIIPALAERRYS